MTQFGKCWMLIALFCVVMTAHRHPVMAMATHPAMKDMYPEVIDGDYCLCLRDSKFNKRNNELIHNLDRVRSIMNVG